MDKERDSLMIGERLKKLRGKKSQEEVAQQIGISRARLSHYETGRSEPDSETLKTIAKFYNVSVDYLLFGHQQDRYNQSLPDLTKKDEKDIAKKLENILESMESDTALSFDGEPMDEETKELVRAAIENNLRLTKQLAKRKFTPKKYRDKE